MKILFGMPSKDSWGGPNSSEPPFVAALSKAGIEVAETEYVYGDKAIPTSLLGRVRRVISTALRLRRMAGEDEYDVIHLNTAFDSKTILRDSFTLKLLNARGAKVFLKFHGSEAQDYETSGWFTRRLIKVIAEEADAFGVHTSDELENFERLGFSKEKFFRVVNVVEVERTGQTPPQKSPDAQFNLAFVSRFVPKKSLVETVEAIGLLAERGLNVRLTCAGDGIELEKAKKTASDLGLGSRIRFTGYVSEAEVTDILCDSDVLLFPTRFGEGFPNVFFKAVALGLPIVSSRFRAARELFPGETNCVYVETDPVGIADGCERLIKDRELRRRLSEANERFGRRLRADRVAKEYLQVYREMTDQ